MRRFLVLAVLAMFTFAMAPVVSAKDKPKGETKEKKVNDINEHRANVLKKDVGLDDATVAKVQAIFNKDKDDQIKAYAEMGAAKKAVRELLKADSIDEAAYTKAMDQYDAAKAKNLEIQAKQKAEWKKVLTPKQQAKMIFIMWKMDKPWKFDGSMKHKKGPHGKKHGK